MALLDFFKNMFGGNGSETAEAIVNETSHPAPKFENLAGAAFKKAFQTNKNAVMLDVRTPLEVRSGAIPGAVNVDFMSASFGKKVAAMDKSKTYFVYCRSGNRSGQACRTMNSMGFDVRNLNGGIGEYPK